MGLLDQLSNMTPEQSQGLLAAASQMLQQSGPSRIPTSFGQILGGGFGAYTNSMQDQKKMKMQQAEQDQMQQMRGLQIQGLQGDLATKQQQRDLQMRIQQRLKGSAAPTDQGTGALPMPSMPPAAQSMGSMLPRGGNSPNVGGPDWMQSWQEQQGQQPAAGMPQAPQAPQQANSPTQVLIGQLTNEAQVRREEGDIDGAKGLYEHIAKLMPKVKDWKEVTVGNKTMYAPYFEDGSSGQPVPYEVAQKLHFQSIGGKTLGLNPMSGAQVTSFDNTQSPESLASNETTRRGQNMTDARARDLNKITREGQQTQVINDPLRGPLLVNKGTGVVRNGVGADGLPIQGEAAAKKQISATGLVPILDRADKLLEGSTGSYIGAGADELARVFGKATSGAKDISQLKVLEGAIMMNQPRMEGPQSDKDVAMYRQMAGQIGDPTVPNELKKSALDTIKEINSRYANGANGAAPVAQNIPLGAANMLKMNPSLRAQFDEKYGEGAAAKVLGK